MSELEENRQKLFSACKSGDKHLLIKLTKSGVIPSAYNVVDNEGKTPLHIACHYGHINIVRLLIEIYGCSPKAVDNTGSTPFHDACYYDQVVIVDYFIHTLSDPNETLLKVDMNDNTPFHKANQAGSSCVIYYILHTLLTGNTPKKLTKDVDCVFFSYHPNYITNQKYYLNLRNKVGDTPLAAACRHGHLTIIKQYMALYCHGYLSDTTVNVPYLLKTASQCGQFEIAYYLQSNYGNISDTNISNYHEVTYCHGIAFDLKHPKHWNTIGFGSSNSCVSFCMAILHHNEEYVNKFPTLQKGVVRHDVCLAASVADNVKVLQHFISDEVMLKFGNRFLHVACEWGSKSVAEYLIGSDKCNLSATNELGETPLHTACRFGSVEIMQLFIKISPKQCSAIFDQFNTSNETPLHLACLNFDTVAIADNILNDCQLSTLDSPDKYGDTPLMNSCRLGSVHLVERLVKMRCNPVCINNLTKETPVHVACRMQRLDILTVLVKNFTGNADHRNSFGETPLCIALNDSCLDIVKFIVQRGLCDVTLSLCSRGLDKESHLTKDQTSDKLPVMVDSPSIVLKHKDLQLGYRQCQGRVQRQVLVQGDKHVVRTSKQTSSQLECEKSGDNAIHFACRKNDFRLLQVLLNHYNSPAGLVVLNNFGQSPIHVAIRNGGISLIEHLISCCEVPLDSIIDNDGNSVLHTACQKGNLKLVRLFLNNCSVTSKNKDGNTPIHTACYNKSAALVGCLLEKCSGNLDHHKNNNNDTLLHVAAAKIQDIHTLKLLLEHCSLMCQNKSGDTPVHIACRANNQSVVKCLLEINVPAEPLVNEHGETYLHAACNENAHLSIVSTIFDTGYITLGNIPNKAGDIPLHYACRYGCDDVIEYLMTVERCDPYIFNRKNLSPMYFTLLRSNFKLMKHLSDKGLYDPNRPLKSGAPLLYCLIELLQKNYVLFHRRMYEKLATHDEYFYVQNVIRDREKSPFVLMKFLDIMSSDDVDFNATNSQGNTALHLACMIEDMKIVRILLSTNSVDQSLSLRNNGEKRPIQLTSNYDIIRLLIQYGANPEDVYGRFASILKKSKEQQPLEPAVKVIVLGNSTAGKTTLVEALKSKKDILQVEGSTAGIETSKYNSTVFGRVTFHDFAGQPEYESSHSAFLERCSSSVQPPLFLLVVNAKQYQFVERRINNWLSFIHNHCTCSSNNPPHVIVIGSHIDEVEDSHQLSHTFDHFVKAIENFKQSDFKCFEPVFLDCRKVSTEGMKTLLLKIKESCLTLKRFIELDCRCHILFANILKWFPNNKVIQVKYLLQRIKQSVEPVRVIYPTSTSSSMQPRMMHSRLEDYSEFLLPVYIHPLIDLLKSLHTGGHILLLESETPENSWIVMNQDALFKTINGILFAPKDFEHHFKLDNNTGVVPLEKLQTLFSDLDFCMVKQFLTLYEFCHKIEDSESLELIHGSKEHMDKERSPSQIYYFFPGFVQSEKPTNIWDTPKESPYSFSCGWQLQCQSREFFETRLLQVLLLRLTFTFVTHVSEASMFKRQCNIWKNGMHWGTRNGVEVLFELREDKTLLVVLVRCFKGQELEAVRLRTAVLKKIWEAKSEFCPKVNVDEYLLHPFCIPNASLQDEEFYQISIKEVAQTVIEGLPCVICPSTNKPLPLDALLYYEPYKGMDKEHVIMLLSNEKSNDTISSETLYNLSTFLHPVYQHLIKVLKIPEAELGFHRDRWRDHPVQLVHHLFESWTSRREKPTFQTLRSEFDDYSIFFGRNPLEICKSKPHPEDTDEDKADYPSEMC